MATHVELTAPLGFLLLHELKTPANGTELTERLSRRRGSPLTPGTMYPALKQLHRKKLVSYRSHGRQKIYRLTNKGSQELCRLYVELQQQLYDMITTKCLNNLVKSINISN